MLYRAFILLNFYYCSQVWHHCGSHNTKGTYKELLKRIGIGSTLENCHIQDMLITINCCFLGRASLSTMNLIKTRDHKYNLREKNMLSITKVNGTKFGLNSFKYYAAKQWNMLPDKVCNKSDFNSRGNSYILLPRILVNSLFFVSF